MFYRDNNWIWLEGRERRLEASGPPVSVRHVSARGPYRQLRQKFNRMPSIRIFDTYDILTGHITRDWHLISWCNSLIGSYPFEGGHG